MSHNQNLFEATEAGDLDRVRELVKEDRGLVDVRRRSRGKKNGQTPLQAAAMAGHLKTVRLLVRSGAEVYAPAQWGYPAVQHAAWQKQQHVVDFFGSSSIFVNEGQVLCFDQTFNHNMSGCSTTFDEEPLFLGSRGGQGQRDLWSRHRHQPRRPQRLERTGGAPSGAGPAVGLSPRRHPGNPAALGGAQRP